MKLGLSNLAPTFCSWITVITHTGGRATLCPATSRRQLGEQQWSSYELKIWAFRPKYFLNISVQFDDFGWRYQFLMILLPKIIKLNSDIQNKYLNIMRHVHVFNSQELHCCLPIGFENYGTKYSPTAILCNDSFNDSDPGAKCSGNIWQTQFLASKISREEELVKMAKNVVAGLFSPIPLLFSSLARYKQVHFFRLHPDLWGNIKCFEFFLVHPFKKLCTWHNFIYT